MPRRADDDDELLDASASGGDETGEGEGAYVRVRVPNARDREMFGITDQLVGGSRVMVNCEDGRTRLGRIRGKMKRRMWIRPGDLLIIKPWDIQDDKCDVRYRYTRTQAIHLAKRKLVPETINIF